MAKDLLSKSSVRCLPFMQYEKRCSYLFGPIFLEVYPHKNSDL